MGERRSGERLGGRKETGAPARPKQLGVKAITRGSGKQVYQIAFSYRGVQCRELMSLPHSKANETYCVRLRGEILGRIDRGDFKYGDYFPTSKRAVMFGHAPATRGRSLKQALEAYRDRVKHTLAPSSFSTYRKSVDNHLVPWCGHMTIPALRPADIRDWVGTQTVKLKTLQNRLLPLRAVLDEAVTDELITFNPLDRVKLVKLVPVAARKSDYKPNPYTTAELFTLLSNIKDLYERWVFQAWAFTGVRTGELVGLRWRSVDLEANGFHVVETTTERKDKDRPKTDAGVRWLPLLPAAREAFDGMRSLTQLAGDRVFINLRSTREDKAWDDKRLAKFWKRAHIGTGIKYRNPYQLRHTFASQLLSQGENPSYIGRLLGHETVEMVQRHYGRWVEEGEKLGFDRPPRQYGMKRLWDASSHVNSA